MYSKRIRYVWLVMLSVISMAGLTSANLIENGSFESPASDPGQSRGTELGTLWFAAGAWGYEDMDGWDRTERIWHVTDGGADIMPDGDYAVVLDASFEHEGVDVLSQGGLNLKEGVPYELSFYVWGESGNPRIDVDLSGADDISLLDDYETDWTDAVAEHVVFRFVPTVTGEYTIEFRGDRYEGSNVHYHAWIDDVRLTTDEPYPEAANPDPENGSMLDTTWYMLQWKPGDFAVSHDVYIGDNFDDVNDGAEGTFAGNQAAPSLIVGFPGFPVPGGLVPGTTYYWRIDEVNEADPNSPWKGPVWSFWIQPNKAYDPVPADGVKYVLPDVTLSWTPGLGARLHYVYFGENFDDVNSAVVGLPQAATSYTPGTLELDKTYYWRIDEFDAVTTHKGDVWSFKTLPFIPITDPNLIAWWKLDEGSGNTALDGSGHNHHGTIGGTPDFVPGYNGDALDFDGSTDYIDVDGQLVSGTFSLTMWIYPRDIPYSSGFYAVLHNDAWNAGSLHVHLRNTTSIINADINSGPGVESTTVLQADQWYHCALTVTTTGGNASKLYINGVLENTGSGGTGTPYLGPMIIGAWDGGTTRHYHGLMDDIRIYDKVLTVEEITLAMRGDPLLAWDPNPTHGSTLYIRDATPFNWSPGDNASQHDVYFGTDRDAVADANATDTTGIYRGRQGVTIYTPPEVEWGGGPYYWRIDEYNTDATISKGNVWTFTVTDFIGIDDFEDYNDYEPDRIFDTWIDGWEVPTNGSMAGYADPPFAETNIVHGGGQSMPVSYDNNFMYSEVSITLVYPRDWTEEGVGVLSLWFYGDASNAAERMYVALNGSATVYHDNPDAALIEEWTEWTIDLQEFAAQGVNLANVNTIAIGFGDKNNLQAGGSGLVFFDDIRLYRPTP